MGSHSSSVLDLGFVYSTFSELCNILVRNILVRNIFVRNIRNIKDLPLFYFKGNSFVLYTKFCDPQFFLVRPDFFSILLKKIWNFLRFFWYPRFFFEFFIKNMVFSQIFLLPPDTPDFFFQIVFSKKSDFF